MVGASADAGETFAILCQHGAVPGTLTLAATPIGNARDASLRLIAALGSAEIVAAEDTRRIRRLGRELEIEVPGQVLSFFAGNESVRTEQLLQRLGDGADVLVVTDAGMPLISDPGYRLVEQCVARQIAVRVLPGPSAVLAALAVSGLPADRFCFEGFLPRKAGERSTALQRLVDEHRTMVFFESPRRTHVTLQAMVAVFGAERQGCVCRELTKTYEEVQRGSLQQLVSWASAEVRGEITIVVAGAADRADPGDPDAWRGEVAQLVAAGATRRDAITAVAQRYGVPRKQVYRAAHE
jgi:16S rRNA (cytidine1402-2'-O)-methyltransferase